jgi:hypothetical protein
MSRAIERRCPFCRMRAAEPFLRIPMCPICRDQVYDFLWASAVNVVIAVPAGLSGRTFVIEEILLFVVLVVVKHRLPPPWLRRS